MTRSLRIAVLLCGAGLARPAGAVSFTSPGEGARLEAGQSVTVEWNGVPGGVRELEVLLSLDDGAHFAVRLTGELEGSARSFVWQVPRLPTRSARLIVRMGSEDEEKEIEGESGPRFEIVSRTEAPFQTTVMRDGEIWIAPVWQAAPDLEGSVGSGSERVSDSPDDGAPALPPSSRRSLIDAAGQGGAPAGAGFPAAALAPVRAAIGTRVTTPLRN